MEDLIDIQGLDAISWWPLAVGWWIIIAVSIAVTVGGAIYLWRRIKYRRSWQYIAHTRLAHLHTQIQIVAPKQTLQNLSLELRKIAMLTTARSSCASLTGKHWLQWLEEHDPSGYNWSQQGELLIAAQYMPETASNDLGQIGALILAAQGWVKKC